ncbi:hypothetical protein REC12_12205 [Desulfosporosinus sp. PR]|uniref:hypothetical protein n=1 Tax=Candidatus Desulfosporosinus nitrosoreducens TaxID=3401928 RepID=UPI0027FA9FB1|nr:hypothetical protein [Desulfosporosinus sp. PR]MDQ7094353.1 hypothetical protein [Desulfosporosinus sp. PR]
MIWAIIATILTAGIFLYLVLLFLISSGGLASLSLPIPLGTAINLGQWVKPESIDLGAAIIGTVVLVLLILFFRRWFRNSAALRQWKYISSLGRRRIAKEIWTALFQDTLLLASVRKRSPKRWLVHSLVLFGFLFMTLATTLAAILNYADAPHGFWWPPRIVGNLGGLSSLIGLSIMGWRLVRDPYEDNGKTYLADLAFVFLLYLTILTGFATEFVTYGTGITLSHGSFLVHVLMISGLFLTLPFTRFNHILLTPFLLILTRLNQALTAENQVPGISAEPAPGRHHKTERLAEDCQRQIFPGEGESPVTLRYYP